MGLSRAVNVGQSIAALAELIAEFQKNEKTLHLIARQALPDDTPGLMVLADQFEEVFMLCPNEDLREALICNLLYAARVAQGQTLVIVTMRADFYAKCAVNVKLAAAFSDHQLLIGPMTEDELRRAIERPAQLVGCELDAGLADVMLQDVHHQPGALPLLQHALFELWKRRQDRRLTLAAYHESGGVKGAIAKTAEEAFKSFNPDEQAIARQIMLRLTRLGEGTEDTRRRVTMDKLVTAPEKAEIVERIVRAMADARLLTTSGE